MINTEENGQAILRAQIASQIDALLALGNGTPKQFAQLAEVAEQAESAGWRELAELANRLRQSLESRCGPITVSNYCEAMRDALGNADENGAATAQLSTRMWG